MPRLKHIQMAAGRRDVLRDPVYSEFRFSLPDARGTVKGRYLDLTTARNRNDIRHGREQAARTRGDLKRMRAEMLPDGYQLTTRYSLDLTPPPGRDVVTELFSGSFQRPAGGTGRLSDAGSFRYAPKDVFCSPGGRFFASVYKVTNETQMATDIPDALALKQRDELDGLDFRLFHIAFGNGAKRSMVSVYDEAASIIAQSGAKIEHVSFSSCCGTRILGRDNRYSTLSLVMGANLWSTLTSQIVSVDIGEWDTEKIMSPTNINESIKVVRLIPCRDKHPSANQLAEALTRSCDRTDVKFELSESGGEPRGQFKSFTDELTKAMGKCRIGPKQPSDTTDVSTGQSSRTKFYGWECWE